MSLLSADVILFKMCIAGFNARCKTTPLLINGCCTMTFAYYGDVDVHCQNGDSQKQIFKLSPKSDLF